MNTINSFLQSFGGGIVAILILLVIMIGSFIIYFLPTIIAFRKNHGDKWLIFLINFFFGGTLIGWIIALVWAMKNQK